MPWTFAHPAAALPFHRLGLPLSGLMAGSVVPDFGYYIGRFDLATYAHTRSGILFLCIPIAFLLVLLQCKFRWLIGAPLPQPHRTAFERLSSPQLGSFSDIAAMVVAILIGAITHVAWDSFTHPHGAAVLASACLRKELFMFAGRPFAVYNVLQHASTCLGIAVLAVVYFRWLKRLLTAEPHHRWGKLSDYAPLATAVTISVLLGMSIACIKIGSVAPYSVVIVRGVIYSTIAFIVVYMLLALHTASHFANR